MSRTRSHGVALGALLAATAPCAAGFSVNYSHDAGGANPNPLNGLAATAIFQTSGRDLSILVRNTSTGVPLGAGASDSLLVSIAFNLPDGILITGGRGAVIGPGSVGVGAWSGLGPGDSVGDDWAWTNHGGGDLLQDWLQVITTSMGNGGSRMMSFEGDPDPNLDGPWGGIAAAPPLIGLPRTRPAVSDSIHFALTLSAPLTPRQLESMALGGVVEFGSDFQYLAAAPVPAPATLAPMAVALIAARRRRRRDASARPRSHDTSESLRVVRARGRADVPDRTPRTSTVRRPC